MQKRESELARMQEDLESTKRTYESVKAERAKQQAKVARLEAELDALQHEHRSTRDQVGAVAKGFGDRRRCVCCCKRSHECFFRGTPP